MGRGPHAADAGLFDAGAAPRLRRACAELSWLLSHGYAEPSALALVGDRYRLAKRQRTAVARSACGEAQRLARRQRQRPVQVLQGSSLAVDGFNCVITVESALAGGVLLRGRDGALRDLASVHGSYRTVSTTAEAIDRLLTVVAAQEPAHVLWWLDRPVSNSGRLKARIEAAAAELPGCETTWEVGLDFDPDARLRQHAGIVASSDAAVLDGCQAWVDLPGAALWSGGKPRAESASESASESESAVWLVDLDVPLPR